MYSLGVPLMLLRGEGSAPAGLVQCVQEALTRTSMTQPLVLYLPRIEVSSNEISFSSHTFPIAFP